MPDLPNSHHPKPTSGPLSMLIPVIVGALVGFAICLSIAWSVPR